MKNVVAAEMTEIEQLLSGAISVKQATTLREDDTNANRFAALRPHPEMEQGTYLEVQGDALNLSL